MKKFVIALCLTLFIAPISKAGDASHLELIGFSQNGTYVAFAQFGNNDSTVRYYIYTSFVSVKNNQLEAEIRTVVNDATMAQLSAKAKTQTATAMRKYGIVSGNQGRFIGVTPPNMGSTISEFFALDRNYGLSIDTKPAPYTKDYCNDAPQLLIVKLMVDGGQTRDLQRDTRLPASRNCAYGYELRSAHLYGRSLAVFVSYKTRGFEGPDSRWMVVTGML